MKKYRITLMWALGIVMSLSHAFGQYQKLSPSFPSPNAASLGQYGEIPVSLFTGVPNISIPLHEVKGNKISLPIALSYHAAGVRPESVPGLVGSGWSLFAGGVITRKQNGHADEASQSDASAGFKVGYYFNYANLSVADWNSAGKLSSRDAYPNSFIASRPEADTEPDEFFFSFGNNSGSFFLDQTGQWQVRSDKHLKVVFNNNDFITPFTVTTPGVGVGMVASRVIRPFAKFTIIDDEGNQYIFGSTDANNTAIEYSDGMIPQALGFGTGIIATSWYLSQIISADGKENINLTYERGPLSAALAYAYSSGITRGGSGSCTIPQGGSGALQVQGRIIFPVYLRTIAMPDKDIVVKFNLNMSGGLNYSLEDYTRVYRDAGLIDGGNTDVDFPSRYLRLTGAAIPFYNVYTPASLYQKFVSLKYTDFDVTNSAGKVLKSFAFKYNDQPGAVNGRLKLTDLNIGVSGIGSFTTFQKYSFRYNNTSLPPYISTITDHWGYNNMKSINVGNFDFATLRAPDETGVNTQAEILTDIIYPTGGKSTFTYEPNKYARIIYRNNGNATSLESGTAGGLRVRKITTDDGAGNLTSKEYFYVKRYSPLANPSTLQSSGVCDSKPMYSFDATGSDEYGTSFTYNYSASNSIVPLTSNTSGAFIGYSTVVEKNSNGGYSIYDFTNHDNGYGDEDPATFNRATATQFVYTSLAFKRGRELSKINYDASGFIVSEEKTTYTSNVQRYTDFNLSTGARAVFSHRFNVCDGRIGISRTAYNLYTYPFVPETKTVKTFSTDGSLSTSSVTTTFRYDQYKNLVERKIDNSVKNPYSTIYRYVPEFAINPEAGNVYRNMLNQNIVSAVVEQEDVVSKSNLKYTVAGKLFTYKEYAAGQFYKERYFNLEPTSPILNKGLTAYDVLSTNGSLTFNSNYRLKETYYYDGSGNMSNVEAVGKNNSFLWDYRGARPVARVLGAANIYESGKLNNPVVDRSLSVFIPFSINSTIYTTVPVEATSRYVKLTFSYNNNGLTGTNNSTIQWFVNQGNFTGAFNQSGTSCTYPTASPNSCGVTSNVANVSGMPNGTYTVGATLKTCTGFQNYYGYFMNINFSGAKYQILNRRKQIAYTSFEYFYTSDLDWGTGNVNNIILSRLAYGSPVTGDRYLNLTSEGIWVQDLDNTVPYVVSYWSKDGAYDVNGTAPVVVGEAKPGLSWKYYEHQLALGTTRIDVKGTGGIDEFRVYPKGAAMETATYNQRYDMTSSCSGNNVITYYTYDEIGRLSMVHDRDGNVIKTYDYSYKN